MTGTVPPAVVTIAEPTTIEVRVTPVTSTPGTVPNVGVSISGAAQDVTVVPVER